MQRLRDGYAAAVIGASGGIGGALADRLERDPRCGRVARLSRRTAPRLDITQEADVAAAAAHLAKEVDQLDCLIIATGVLTIGGRAPEKALTQLEPAAMAQAFAVNTIGPALLLKHVAALAPRREASVVGVLSARVGSIHDNALGGWISYRASKAALNQVVRTAALEFRRTRPQLALAALQPGTVKTPLSAPYAGARPQFTPEAAAQKLYAVLDALTPEDSGAFLDHAGARIPW